MASFKRLKVWQQARELVGDVYRVTASFPAHQRFALCAQMQRAAVSVCSNIAEGCGRGGDRELKRFLWIARGSANEVECQAILAQDLGFLDAQASEALGRRAQRISAELWLLLKSVPA